MESDQFNRRLGAAIQRLRVDAGLAQEEAAHRAGLSVSTWSRVELGKQSFHANKLPAIAAALGVKIAHLFDGLD